MNSVSQEMLELQVEIYLRPYVSLKYDSHSAGFYETHACLTKTSKYSCTEFHENPTNVLVADAASRTEAVST
jgi:hypothetical protein